MAKMNIHPDGHHPFGLYRGFNTTQFIADKN
jgi:hypothetical protein